MFYFVVVVLVHFDELIDLSVYTVKGFVLCITDSLEDISKLL